MVVTDALRDPSFMWVVSGLDVVFSLEKCSGFPDFLYILLYNFG